MNTSDETPGSLFPLLHVGTQASYSDALTYSSNTINIDLILIQALTLYYLVMSILTCSVSIFGGGWACMYFSKTRELVKQGKYSFTGATEGQLISHVFHIVLVSVTDLSFLVQFIYRLIESRHLDVCNVFCIIVGLFPILSMAQVPWHAYMYYLAATENDSTPVKSLTHVQSIINSFVGLMILYTVFSIGALVQDTEVTSYRGLYWASCAMTSFNMSVFLFTPLLASFIGIICVTVKAMRATQNIMNKLVFTNHGCWPLIIFVVTWFPMVIDFTAVTVVGVETSYTFSLIASQLAKMQGMLLAIHLFVVTNVTMTRKDSIVKMIAVKPYFAGSSNDLQMLKRYSINNDEDYVDNNKHSTDDDRLDSRDAKDTSRRM